MTRPFPGRAVASPAVVGFGDIGSHFVAHLARVPGLAYVILVDRDPYEAANLPSQ